jgi:thiamine-monophosphate kinase
VGQRKFQCISFNKGVIPGGRSGETQKGAPTPSIGFVSYPREVPTIPARIANKTASRKSAVTANAPAQGELSLIRQIRQRAPSFSRSEVRLGIGDDCALLRPRRGEEFAVTTDLSIAGRHFWLAIHPPESIGHRAIVRGLSDLAALGARPVAALVSLAVPRKLAGVWTSRFYDGLLALANAHKTALAGGDLSESPIPLADIVLVGSVPAGKALLRSGARPGEVVYVTGTLGGSAAGLARLAEMGEPPAGSAKRRRIPRATSISGGDERLALHLYPQPRIAQGLWLRRRGIASAAIDLSDGLSIDITHLCEESGVAAEIDAALLPIHPAATLEQALHGGEDYELLFTAPASARVPKAIAGVPVTRIGRILKRGGKRASVTLNRAEGARPLHPAGWQHFA